MSAGEHAHIIPARDTELLDRGNELVTDDLRVGKSLEVGEHGSVIDRDDVEADGFRQTVYVDRHMTAAQEDQSVSLGEFTDIGLTVGCEDQIGALSPIQLIQQFLQYSSFHLDHRSQYNCFCR